MKNKSETLRDNYALRFSGKDAYRNAVWKLLCSEYFSKYIGQGDTVLDLGAGWGEFSNNVVCAQKLAMDLNPETGSRLHKEIRFLHQDCSQLWDIESESLDVIFTSNFLEHLPHKESLEQTMEEASRCLKKGGRLLCLGPNIKYVPGAYWDFWDHHIPLTEHSLSELLQLKGFSIDLCLPRFLPYSMSTERQYPLFMLETYLKLPQVWRLFGKQFFIIGRK